MTATDLVHRYQPRGAALRLFEHRGPEVLLSGPAGTGKSLACLEKLHLLALLNPGMRALIVRKTLVSLGSTGLVTWRQQVIAEAERAGVVSFHGGSQASAAAYRYGNGSTIVVGGLDRPSRIMSSEYDVAFVQEATELDEDDWEALTTRLRHGRITFQQLIADCNPSTPTHWLKARADRGATTLLESRHEDNPTLIDDAGRVTERGAAYLAKLDALTGPRHARLRKGLWVAAEGTVYEDYDPAVHLVDRFDVPAEWTRWWSVDFGYTAPLTLQCWAEDPDGRLVLYREIYHSRRLVEDHARTILAAVHGGTCDPAATDHAQRHRECSWVEPRPRAVICDHDAEDRATLERHLGMGTTAARKSVSDGIQAVQARLRPAGDGRPRLLLMRDALLERDQELVDAGKPACTAEEVPGYIWDVGGGKRVKEAPVKQDDHGCDAARYLVAERDLGARPRIRVLG